MSIVSKTFYTNPGSYVFATPDIFFVRILGVKRDGVGLTQSLSPSLTSRQFYYGSIFITVPTTNRFNVGEKIWILYEE